MKGCLLAGGEMFCREEQSDVGLWVWKEGGGENWCNNIKE